MWMGWRSLMTIFLVGCTPTAGTNGAAPADFYYEDGKSLEERREEAIAAFDHEACATKQGAMTIEGLLGMPRCTISYIDAGAPCNDGSDCQGRCLASDQSMAANAPAGQVTGICAATDSPFGCYATVTNGAADPAICVD